ncbi:MAG: DUF1631 family protein [Pseudomonadota bacterium]
MRGLEQDKNEKRVAKRKKLQIKTTLYSLDHSSLECHIIDFSEHGLLIEPETSLFEPVALSLSSKVQIMITVETTKGKHNIILKGHIVRRCENQYGIKLLNKDDIAVAILEKLAAQNLPQQRLRPAKSIELAHSCEKKMLTASQDMLASFMPRFLSKCHDVLFDEAKRARNNHMQQVCFDAKTAIAKNQSKLVQGLIDGFSKNLEQLTRGKPQTKEKVDHNITQKTLALLEDSVFDDWLMIRAAASKIESVHVQVIYELSTRLSEICLLRFDEKNMPLASTVIVEVFVKSLRKTGVPRESLRIILDCFRDAVIHPVGQYYVEINQWLIEKDILVDLFNHAKNNGADYQPVDLEEVIHQVRERQEQVALQKKVDTLTKKPNKPVPPVNELPINDETPLEKSDHPKRESNEQQQEQPKLEKLTQQIQEEPSNRLKTFWQMTQKWTAETLADLGLRRDDEIAPTDLKNALHGQDVSVENFKKLSKTIDELTKKMQLQKALSELDQSMISFVETFFDEVVNDTRLDEKAKPLLNGLQVPAFSRLLDSDNMFSNDEHPLSTLVNYISKLGIKNNTHFHKHHKKIKHDVEELINLKGDEQLVKTGELCRYLSEIIHEQNSAYQKNIQRVYKVCEGKSQLFNTKRIVDEKLKSIAKDKKLPKVFKELLDAGWKNLLILSMSNDKEKHGLSVYWQVIESLANVEFLQKGVKKEMYLQIIKEGLAKVQGGTIQTPHVIKHIAKLFDSKQQIEFIDEQETKKAHFFAEKEKKSQRPVPVNLNNWLAIVDGLRIGDYIELLQFKAPILAKLAWMDNSTELMVFVNEQGVKVSEYSRKSLAEALYYGEVLINYEAKKPLMPQVMQRVSKAVQATTL